MKNRRREAANRVRQFAVCLLLAVVLMSCTECSPQLRDRVKKLVTGGIGPMQEAFETLTDSLERGEPVAETFSETAELLFPS